MMQISHLNRLIYPDAEILALQPNALGQQRSVGGYVGVIKYHPNGAIKSYVMANDTFRTTTQQINGAIGSIIDRHPGAIIFNQTYQYDLNLNTVAINQSTVITNSTIALNYDGLDRLIGFSSALLGGLQLIRSCCSARPPSDLHRLSNTSNIYLKLLRIF